MTANKRPIRVVEQIAQSLQAWLDCIAHNNHEWREKHDDTIMDAVKRYLPHGGGFDAGTGFDFDLSKPDRLIFRTSFHHMGGSGMYDGWTFHNVVITPSFVTGFDLKVTGPNRNDIKDYIAETFEAALSGDYLTAEQEREERLWQEANR